MCIRDRVQAGPQVSLNVVDTDVRDVLNSLARLGNANIVTDGDIKGNITIQIHSLDFDSALDLVTKMKGLTYHKAGDVILVGPKDNMSSNFGSMHIFQLKYANPSTVISAASLALGYTESDAKTPASTDVYKRQFVEFLAMHYMAAKIFAAAIVTVWNYILKRRAVQM